MLGSESGVDAVGMCWGAAELYLPLMAAPAVASQLPPPLCLAEFRNSTLKSRV